MTVISSTPLAGEVTRTRLTRGRCAADSNGPSWPILFLACSVVHGAIWSGGRAPASVSASACANLLGQAPSFDDGRAIGWACLGGGCAGRSAGRDRMAARAGLARPEPVGNDMSSKGGAVAGTATARMLVASGEDGPVESGMVELYLTPVTVRQVGGRRPAIT